MHSSTLLLTALFTVQLGLFFSTSSSVTAHVAAGSPLKFVPEHNPGQVSSGTESWSYVTVRPKAHMFYWLYETTHHSGPKKRPLILWLQGGPGGSGTGFGNFLELGPLDVDLKPRNTTWLQTASLLFIDNPVGAGYSYVEDNSALTKTLKEICDDLLTVMKFFIKNNPDYQDVPFYIFSESYGGKMTAGFSDVLYKAISKGDIKMNFKGLAMGDSWIDPVSFCYSWGQYLFSTSIACVKDMEDIAAASKKIEDAINEGKYDEATSDWGRLEELVEEVSGGVNFYNIMDWTGDNRARKNVKGTYLEKLYHRHVGVMQEEKLGKLMNGAIREKLKIIPADITWGGQSQRVFDFLSADFMRSVVGTVNDLINGGNLTVVVYQGELDLICNTIGASNWFYKYMDIAEQFKQVPRRDSHSCNTPDSTCYYSKTLRNFQFYWILKAGHMVPADNGEGALAMVNQIIGK